MGYTYDTDERETVSEMAIVDTFTKVIFGEEDELTPRESMIVQGFRTVDPNVLTDSYPEMGEYLRNLGVREMIHLVSRIREQLSAEAAAAMGEDAADDFGGPAGARRHH